MKRLAIAGLVVLVVLAVAAPVVTGSITRSSWEQMRDSFNQSGGGVAVLENLEYQQGYLSTDVLSKVTLSAPEFDEPVEVFLRSAVAHGLTSARVETRLDPERHPNVLALFGQDKPVLISHGHLNGDFDGALTVPAVEGKKEEMAFRWSPLTAEFTLVDDGDSAQVHLGWDGFEAKQGDDFLRLGEISLAEDMSRLMGEVWVGKVAFSVAGLSGRLPESGTFAVKKATLLAETRQGANGRLENQMDLGVESLQTNEQPYGEVRMRFLAEGFDVEATNEVLVAASRMNEVDGEAGPGEQAVQQLELFSDMMDAVRGLMARGLNVGIPVMVVETPEGSAELEFHFSHPEIGDEQRAGVGSVFQHSEGGLSIKLPSGVIKHLPVALQQRLFQLYQQGILLEKDGALLLNVELDGMTLSVNGQPVPIPPLI